MDSCSPTDNISYTGENWRSGNVSSLPSQPFQDLIMDDIAITSSGPLLQVIVNKL